MAVEQVKIAICKDDDQWHVRFAKAIDSCSNHNFEVAYNLVDINSQDWINIVDDYDIVIWKPYNMGTESSSYFKEKIYFIEKYLNKIVVPNFSTIWHFESKVAQSYIFDKLSINTPKTTASFDFCDSMLQLNKYEFPLVFKKSFGASSNNVRLIKNKKKAESVLKRIFCSQLYRNNAKIKGKWLARFSFSFIRYLLDTRIFGINQRVAYWQQFVPGNSKDLRITVIGDKYAFGFWRMNRPNDFRASGSGNIDYETPVPEDAIRYCLDISRKLGFDSMAYDIIFKNGELVIVEMSYGYIDSAIYKAKGYHELLNGALVFNPGNYWPQEIWIKWIFDSISLRYSVGKRHAYR
jgi:glutathione synthase/RimK-type ligase-like ATP-grasp enzyme